MVGGTIPWTVLASRTVLGSFIAPSSPLEPDETGLLDRYHETASAARATRVPPPPSRKSLTSKERGTLLSGRVERRHQAFQVERAKPRGIARVRSRQPVVVGVLLRSRRKVLERG